MVGKGSVFEAVVCPLLGVSQGSGSLMGHAALWGGCEEEADDGI